MTVRRDTDSSRVKWPQLGNAAGAGAFADHLKNAPHR
jgi:hypothetical protein